MRNMSWSRHARTAYIRWMALLVFSAALACLAVMAGEPKAGERPSPLELLRAQIVPDDAPARPPCLPARYDVGLPPVQRAKQCLAAVTEQAAARQERLQRLWMSIRNDSAQGKTPDQQADVKLLSYAFGETDLDEASKAAQAAGPAAQFRLASLLLAECRFDEAIHLLAALADLPARPAAGVIPRRALSLLARHDAQRAALEKHIALIPLSFDLPGYLARRGQDPATHAFIESVRQTTSIRLPAEFGRETTELPSPSEPEQVLLTTASVDLTAETLLEPADSRERAKLHDLNRLYLSTGGPEFVLSQDGREWISGDCADLMLDSEFNGPIRFRLYRCSTREAWQEVRASTLGRLKPERTWTKSFQPLEENNHAGILEPVRVDGLREGYYLLTAEARYAPMLAGCKFCVSNVAVYLRAGHNQAVAVAVDRRDGRPVPDLPLRLHIAGEPDAKLLCERAKPAVEDAFLRGFRGRQAEVEYASGPPAEDEKPKQPFVSAAGDPFASPTATVSPVRNKKPLVRENDAPFGAEPDHASSEQRFHPSPADDLRAAESYAQGVEARRQWPDFQQDRPLRTGTDGTATVLLDLSRREYRYTLEVQRMSEELDSGPPVHVSLDYQEPAPDQERNRAFVWLAQPIHRPGDMVDFAGLLRRFDGTHLADSIPASTQENPNRSGPSRALPKEVRVSVAGYYGTLWEGRCAVSRAGVFHGRFRIPLTTRMGPCWFTIDDILSQPSRPLVVEEFRTSTYQVGLSLPRRVYAGGERMEGRVDVVYFTGKPAEGAEVEVALETAQQSSSVTGNTGADGAFHFSLPVPLSSSEAHGVLRATVTDISGQSYTQVEDVMCRDDPFQVRLAPSVDGADPDTTIELEVEANTWAGGPVAGATVTAVGVRQTAATDREGKARLPWTVTGKDTQQVQVTVIAAGKAVHQSCQVYIRQRRPDNHGTEEETASSTPQTVAITSWEAPARSDAGEPLACTLKLKGPRDRGVTVAVFAESDRLLASHVFYLRPGEHHLAIPTAKDWAPGARLVAVLVDDRRSEPKSAYCYLHPKDKFLRLEIRTDKAQYRPGERCTAVVTASDYQGRPAPGAEISLGVVDEALYQVREDPLPDLFRMLYEYQVPDRCVGQFEAPAPQAESLQFLLGPRWAWGYYPPEWKSGRHGMFGSAGGTKGYERTPRLPVRHHFETAAHWVADLVTGADGTARTTFNFPDNVTSWRFTARGVTADTRVGDIRATRRTLLPLAVDVALPRGFRVGDSIDLPVVVHNYADRPRTIGGTTRVGQADEQAWAGADLAARGQRRLTIPVTASSLQPLEILATVRDVQGGDADVVRRVLVPLPRNRPIAQAWSGPLETEAVVGVDREAENGEDLTIVVRREPGLAGPVQSALEDLVQYPYGCVEQTMSRFMPAVVAREAIEKTGLRNPAAERLPEVVTQGLARLASFQHVDGGWGWWKEDETNDFMTAYVLEGLARCHRLGQPVDSQMLRQASHYLGDRLKDRQLHGRRPGSIGDVNLYISAAHALALLYGQDREEYQQGLSDVRTVMTWIEEKGPSPRLLDQVLLADAWRLLGNRALAMAELERLAGKSIPTRADRSSIFTAAATLELGVALEPADARWPLLARQLVAARTDSGWGDTLTNSAAVRGLAAALAVPRASQSPIAVDIDGRQVGLLTAAGGDRIELKLRRIGTVTLHPAVLPCEDFYQIRIEGPAAVRGVAPCAPAVTIRTRLFQTQPLRKEMNADAGSRLVLARGKTYEMQIGVELKQPVSYARLTLPRPCGMELVRTPKRADGLAAIEVRDDALHFFIDHWEAGRHEVVLPIRTEVTGTVTAPQPELSPMYGDSLPTATAGAREWHVKE